jgi:Fe-S cluster biogenesis protein NfuA
MSEETRVPVTVYMEMTPNPEKMKFVVNKYLLISGESAEFTSQASTKGFSPLADELFNLPFVKEVFISANFVTITKTENISWDFVTMELREFIKEFISAGKDVLIMLPSSVPVEKESQKPLNLEPSEYDEMIVGLLNEFVRPAVESDGGAIDFISYKDGTVTVELKGACSGCPSSTATLKGGVESLLKQHIPEVTDVIALEG